MIQTLVAKERFQPQLSEEVHFVQNESKGVKKGSWLNKLGRLWKMLMTSVCVKVTSNAEAKNEITQRFKKSNKRVKGGSIWHCGHKDHKKT